MHIKRSLKLEDIFIIVAASILIIIVIGILFLLFTSPSTQQESNLPITPTANPQKTPTPTPPPAKTVGHVLFEQEATDRMLDKLDNREPLADTDSFAKARILSLLPSGEVSGVIHQTPNIIIDYTNSVNEFQVEILTENVAQAKSEAVVWFLAQGMSQKAICDYPLVFYLRLDIADSLKAKNIPFSPLAPGC